jgi:hypothetical protein
MISMLGRTGGSHGFPSNKVFSNGFVWSNLDAATGGRAQGASPCVGTLCINTDLLSIIASAMMTRMGPGAVVGVELRIESCVCLCMCVCVCVCAHVRTFVCACMCLRVPRRLFASERRIVLRRMRLRRRGPFIEEIFYVLWSAHWNCFGEGRRKEALRTKISGSDKSARYDFSSLGRTYRRDPSCRHIRCSFKSNWFWVFDLGAFRRAYALVAFLHNCLWFFQDKVFDVPRGIGVFDAPRTRDQPSES